VRAEIITEYRAKLEKDVADAKTTVEETTGLLSKANTLVSASAAFETAKVDLDEATNELAAEKAKFDALNNGTTATLNTTGLADDFSDYAVTDGTANIIEVDGGKLVIATAGEDVEGIDALLAAAQAEYQSLLTEDNTETRLQTAIKSVLLAENDDVDAVAQFEGFAKENVAEFTVDVTPVDNTEYSVTVDGTVYSYTTGTGDVAADIATGLANAIGGRATTDTAKVILPGTDPADVVVAASLSSGGVVAAAADIAPLTPITDYYAEADAVTNGEYDAAVNLTDSATAGLLTANDTADYFTAQSDLNSFNKAVADFQAIAEVQSDSADLAQGTADAIAAVEEFDVELNDTGTGTEANDLFVYAEEAITISGFGLQGEDQLYIGEGFSEQRLADDVTDTRLGDSATLEVFFQQEGNNAAIYVENEAFAGNATNASDLTKITLTGVSIDDLQFENGYVSVVEAA